MTEIVNIQPLVYLPPISYTKSGGYGRRRFRSAKQISLHDWKMLAKTDEAIIVGIYDRASNSVLLRNYLHKCINEHACRSLVASRLNCRETKEVIGWNVIVHSGTRRIAVPRPCQVCVSHINGDAPKQFEWLELNKRLRAIFIMRQRLDLLCFDLVCEIASFVNIDNAPITQVFISPSYKKYYEMANMILQKYG